MFPVFSNRSKEVSGAVLILIGFVFGLGIGWLFTSISLHNAVLVAHDKILRAEKLYNMAKDEKMHVVESYSKILEVLGDHKDRVSFYFVDGDHNIYAMYEGKDIKNV
jgi:hypothetical protein